MKHTEVKVKPLNEADDPAADFRRDWQERNANSGETYEAYQPAYGYGYRMARDPRYQGRDWSDVEENLKKRSRTHSRMWWSR